MSAIPMMMTTMPEFLALIGKPTRNQINLTNYYGHTFRCACGFTHLLDKNLTVLCEGYLKLIVMCPVDSQYLSSIRTRLYCIDRLDALEGAFGTKTDDVNDQLLLGEFMCST